MLFRSLVAVAALFAASPALAHEPGAAIQTAAAAYVRPSNAERLAVIVDQLTAAGLPHEIQTFEGGNQRSGPMAGSNVVVTLGDGPRDIVLTAHYDAVKLSDGSMSQGVVDNAGSVLAMIEAMKTLKGQATDHRLIFVLTDQEELGLIGAKAWLAAHDKSRIHAVINADVAAYGRTVMYGENNGGQSGFVLGALRAQCAEQAVDCVAFPIYPPSDDRVFSAAGVPTGRRLRRLPDLSAQRRPRLLGRRRARGLAGNPGRRRGAPDVAGLQRRRGQRPEGRLRPAGLPAHPFQGR